MMEKAGRPFPPEEKEPAGHTLKERPAGVTIITLGTHDFIIRMPFSKDYLFVFFFLVDRLAFFLVAFFLVAFFLVDRLVFFLAAFFFVAFFFAIGFGSFPECAPINGPAIPLGAHWGE